jgi:transcriptional regulator with XRE-family HTH domain
MNEINRNFADNLTWHRKQKAWTQIELAERLHYSDKAISKWERGESVPDVTTLKQIADLFGVTVDALISAPSEKPVPSVPADPEPSGRKRLITALLSGSLVWLVATVAYVVLKMVLPDAEWIWLMFIFAIPAFFIVLLVFACLWAPRWTVFLMISLLAWSIALVCFLAVPLLNGWMFFLIPIPIEVISYLWFMMKRTRTAK